VEKEGEADDLLRFLGQQQIRAAMVGVSAAVAGRIMGIPRGTGRFYIRTRRPASAL
jgi:hypothetical protein